MFVILLAYYNKECSAYIIQFCVYTEAAAAERAEKLHAKKRKLDSQTPGPVVDITSNDVPCDHEDTNENGFWKEVGIVKLVEEDRYVQYVQCVCMHMMLLTQSSTSSASYVHCS